MIILIDNYDSFTYNLYQMVGVHCPDIEVVRNDATSVQAILAAQPSQIILSPGPGRPENAGICLELVGALAAPPTGAGGSQAPADGSRAGGGQVPSLLGVCLGHQAIAQALGGRIDYAPELMHGKASEIEVVGEKGADDRAPAGGRRAPGDARPSSLFHGLPQRFLAARYHSLIVNAATLPDCLRVTAQTPVAAGRRSGKEGCLIMALEHRERPIFGIQFHPESILTPLGERILLNFLAV